MWTLGWALGEASGGGRTCLFRGTCFLCVIFWGTLQESIMGWRHVSNDAIDATAVDVEPAREGLGRSPVRSEGARFVDLAGAGGRLDQCLDGRGTP